MKGTKAVRKAKKEEERKKRGIQDCEKNAYSRRRKGK